MADESGFEALPTQASSQIDQVFFNAETSQGRVSFIKNGSLYEYDDCTMSEAEQIASGAIGGSVGRDVWDFGKGIKNFPSHLLRGILWVSGVQTRRSLIACWSDHDTHN